MAVRIWEQCTSWLDSVISGEMRLTADVLWLTDLTADSPPIGQTSSERRAADMARLETP